MSPTQDPTSVRSSSERSEHVMDAEKVASLQQGPVIPEVPISDAAKAVQDGPTNPHEDDSQYPGLKKTIPIMLSLYLAVFLVTLDRLIISTAIPKITDEFHDVGEVGWFASSYLLTQAAFQLLMGRLSTFYSPKWVFLASILIFEIGSTICGAAPNSTAFIIGRAVAGLGSAGIFSGAIVIIVVSTRTALIIRKKQSLILPSIRYHFTNDQCISGSLEPSLESPPLWDPYWVGCSRIRFPGGGVSISIYLLALWLSPSSS